MPSGNEQTVKKKKAFAATLMLTLLFPPVRSPSVFITGVTVWEGQKICATLKLLFYYWSDSVSSTYIFLQSKSSSKIEGEV